MKLTYSAALALSGWSLLLPPLDYINAKVLTDAPIQNWEWHDTFDTRQECTEHLVAFVRNVGLSSLVRHDPQKDACTDRQLKWPIGTAAKSRRIGLDRARAGICVSTDDPRLKLK